MNIFFTPTAIISGAVVAFFVGLAWYSPILFRKAWLKGEGLTEEQLPKRSNRYRMQVAIYALLSHGCIAAVLAFIFDIIEVSTLQMAVSLSLLLTLGLIVSTRFIDMIYTTQGTHWELRAQIKFLVSSAYYLVISSIIASVLFFATR